MILLRKIVNTFQALSYYLIHCIFFYSNSCMYIRNKDSYFINNIVNQKKRLTFSALSTGLSTRSIGRVTVDFVQQPSTVWFTAKLRHQ